MALFNPTKDPQGEQPNVPFALPADAALHNISPSQENGLDIEKYDQFWFRPSIEPLNWNKNFPYQLTLVKLEKNGEYTFSNNWSYTLPVPPESLNISNPFASTIYATQGGVIEEHNGIPFKNISISGTTGILPTRSNAGVAQGLGPIQSVFAGTVRTAGRALNITNNLGLTKVQNLVTDDEINSDIGKGSGYYQFHTLANFLERYAAFKKTENGKDYRLAFMMWKDQNYYLVKPESFNLSRTANSPFEYKYSLAFKAWKRIKFNGNNPNAYSYIPAVRDAGVLGKVLQGAMEARNALSVAVDTMQAAGQDIDNSVFEPLRQTINFCKDLLAVPKTMADVPKQLIKDAAGAVVLFVSTKQDFESFNKPGPDGIGAYQKEWETMIDVAKEVGSLGSLSLTPDFNTSNIINNINRTLNNLNSNGQQQLNSYLASPVQRIFQNTTQYTTLFDSIPIGSLQISNDWHKKVTNDGLNIRQNSNRAYWEKQVLGLEAVLNSFELSVGAGNDVVIQTYNKGVNDTNKTPTDEDFDIIYNLNLAIESMSQLATSEDVNLLKTDPTSYIAGLANRAGIAFTKPIGKFLVPFPYGFSLELVATKYLNDPDRWLEIAALNGLAPPYVDEVGFDLPLLANGFNNQIIVADASNLIVGQSINLISNSVPKTNRIIEKIKKLDTNYFILFLSGNSDLGSYLINDLATLHAFKPNTVNSQMSIFIPSNEIPEYEDFIYKPIPNINNLDQLFQIANIDLLLDNKNDIIVTKDGDTPLAVGLNAIIQDLRIKVLTVRNSIILHPTFGLPIDIGYSLADVKSNDILKAIRDTFKGDPTYTNFSSAQVNVNGPTSQIVFTVGLRGLIEILPITIDLS